MVMALSDLKVELVTGLRVIVTGWIHDFGPISEISICEAFEHYTTYFRLRKAQVKNI